MSVAVIDGQFSCTRPQPGGTRPGPSRHRRRHRLVCRQLVEALGGEMATWREGEDFLTSFAIPAVEAHHGFCRAPVSA
ncbi:MAG: hypothetical protein U5Q44_01440 [Dehalococcoidia bacterium]|nr:hypothetical protein [Dehalococcoidia bacterium]